MNKTYGILLLTLLLSFVLMGCGKEEERLSITTEAAETEDEAGSTEE